MTRVVEADVVIVGSGISASMVAEKLAAERRCSIVVVEAGDESDPLAARAALRRRFLDYGETSWQKDHLDGYDVPGMQSRSMQVGGLAMHWGGVTPRFSPEDFRIKSLFGIHDDWPIGYEDLDPFYQEAEERLGVAGEQGPAELDPRNKPFPQPALPLTYNLALLKEWAAKAGIATWSQPSSKNSVPYRGRPACCRNDTCFPSCPIGAKYSPDFTWNALRKQGRVQLLTRTVVRRLECAAGTNRIERAVAVSRDRPGEPIELRAKTFVVAAGFLWSAHLLLSSRSGRYPDGLANRSGLVGKYLCGHRNVSGYVALPMKLFPGINEQHSLVSKQFMRKSHSDRYFRHDLRIWESTVGQEPRLRTDDGKFLLGDALLADWRRRTETGSARLRCYYDVIPDRASELVLDASRKTPWGDPLPRITWRDADVARTQRGANEQAIKDLFEGMAKAGNGKVLSTRVDEFQDHPAGGCRMGNDPTTSAVDGWGRAHDHENLFVVGAPTAVSASLCQRYPNVLRLESPLGRRDRAGLSGSGHVIGGVDLMKRLLLLGLLTATVPAWSQSGGGPVSIFASRVLDGRGGSLKNATVVIDRGRILRIEPRKVERPTYDFTGGTLLPGLIDIHVHATAYVNQKNRMHAEGDGESLAQAAYAAAANAYRTLVAGFTTVASIGAGDDRDLRDAINRGEVPGPRILTTLEPITDAGLSEQQLRAEVKARVAAGANLIKLFASKSIRDGGAQTMSEAQLRAACDEAKLAGVLTIVHAHSAESMKAASLAGCHQIEHGVFATAEVLQLMASKGTYFGPQCALVFRNYLDNRQRFQGIGNFTAEGFASMENAIPLAIAVNRLAATTPGLKLVYGTDAVAGAHGRNAEDLYCRVRQAGHRPMDAIVSATSRNAEALGLKDVGAIATGMNADLVVVSGNPLDDIGALGRVMMVMRGGHVYRHDPTENGVGR